MCSHIRRVETSPLGRIAHPTYFPRFVEAVLHGQNRNGLGHDGGGGGGGGGGGDTTQAAGGGSGGAVLVVVAKHMVINTSGSSSFRSQGGNGGEAKFARCGGGGGGGGGFVCLVYQTARDHNGNYLSDSDLENLIDVSGGAGGKGVSPGVDGSSGGTGNKIVFRHG